MTHTRPADSDAAPRPAAPAAGGAQVVELDGCAPLDSAGQRLDAVAAQMFADYSRTRLKRWIESGELRVDGAVWRPRDRLTGGERLQVHAQLLSVEDWQRAQPLQFELLYSDAAVHIVNKPAGLVVHPGAGNPDGTLVNGLLERDPDLAALPRAGIVHRLDVGTTGLLVVARTLAAHAWLSAALARREVRRIYEAVVEGKLTSGMRIDAPIARDRRQRVRMAINSAGRPARTEVRVTRRFAAHTHVEARLETGRTHQIRVHLAARGHPLVGDRLYGARGVVPALLAAAPRAQLRAFARPALHARTLAFVHPDGHWCEFSAPLPDDFQHLLRLLSAANSDPDEA